MSVTLTFDAHDDAFASVVESAFDTYVVTLLQCDFVGSEVSDVFLVVFRDGDEVLHGLGGHGEVFLFVREGRLSDVYDVVCVLDIVFDLFECAFDEEQLADGWYECALLLSSLCFDEVSEWHEGVESIFSGVVSDFEFFLWAVATQ